MKKIAILFLVSVLSIYAYSQNAPISNFQCGEIEGNGPGCCISFEDLSLNNPTSWSWEFEGAFPIFSDNQNPTQICYEVEGIYAVRLTTSNEWGEHIIEFDDYVQVGGGVCACGTQLGINETNSKSFEVYPNPIKIGSSIKFSYKLNDAELVIINTTGSIVCEISNIYDESVMLNSINLQTGLYFIQIIDNEGIIYSDKIFITE